MIAENLLATPSFMPHGTCYLWKPGLVGLHLISNAMIAISYFSIPITLVYVLRQRSDLPFHRLFFLVAAFIVFCGLGHGMDIWTLWHPNYWVAGIIRAITAMVSLITAIAAIDLVPQILTLPSPTQLQEVNQKLTAEIQERQAVEQDLRQSEERWQLILQGTGDGIFDWNVVTGEAFMSKVLKESLGYRETEVENHVRAWEALLHPDDIEPTQNAIQAHFNHQTPQYRVEYRLRCADGSYQWTLARGKAQWDESGKPIRMVGSHQDISDRKQIETDLRESEARYRLLADHSSDLISTHTPEGIFRYASPASRRLLGYEPQDLIGRSLYDFLHPDDAASLQNTYTLVGQWPREFTHSYRIRHQDGSYIWLESTCQMIQPPQADPILLSVARNITPRKQIEAEITQLNQELEQRVERRTAELQQANQLKDELLHREQQARSQAEAAEAEIKIYQDIVKNIPIGMLVWHLEDLNDIASFRLVRSNPAANQLLGIDLQAEVGQQIVECFPNVLETTLPVMQQYFEVVRSQQAIAIDQVCYGDARICETLFSVRAFPLPGQRLGVAFENITERKRIETALAESERLYRSVLNSVQEVIFQTDLEGHWTFLSPAWADITEYSIAESLYQPWTNYIYLDDHPQECLQKFQNLINGIQTSYVLEFRSPTKGGNFRWLEMDIQLNCNAEGEIIGSYGTINDITPRKQTEAVLAARAHEMAQLNAILLATTAQLEKRNQELDQFAYVASHDLKAPLRAIANLSEWLEEDLEDKLDEDTQHQMNLLRGRVHRMENLINGLLQYSRVGRVEANKEHISVGQLLEEVIDLLDFPSEFTLEIQAEMPTLTTERLALQQVFSNLISNAIKHHDRPDGRITISVQEQGKFYQFAVTDDGPGIAPEYQEKVFAIFQTLKARDQAENTGIGLAIVKKIVETYHGKIQLSSQVGVGSTFQFTWPKRAE